MGPQLTHVLIVDDEPAISKALATALSRAGFRVSTALSGETAMTVVRGQEVDALVVDLRIGDLRGDALFELAAATQPHLRKKTLFTTGDISERAQELIEATGCPLLRKPFELREMIDWVRSVTPKASDQTA
jgi:two-component system response regulator GlrR